MRPEFYVKKSNFANLVPASRSLADPGTLDVSSTEWRHKLGEPQTKGSVSQL